MIKFYLAYTYEGNYSISPTFDGESLSEIYEQAKHVYKVMGVPVTIVLLNGGIEIARLPL